MRRRGFSLVEVIAAFAVLSIVVMLPLSLKFAEPTEEELIVKEAENLARWLDNIYLEAEATKQKFGLHVSLQLGKNCQIFWDSGKLDTYTTGGNVSLRLINVPVSKPLDYNPVSNSNSPVGMTIMVCKQLRGFARFVKISNFARVRVDTKAY